MLSFRVAHLAFLLGSWAVSGYLVVLPLLRPREQRGNFLYGYYGELEVYLGVPALLVALAATVVLLVPSRRRRSVGLRVFAATAATLIAIVAFDLTFALIVRGALQPDYWLDFGHISRSDSIPDPELGFVRRPHVDWRGPAPGSGKIVEYHTDERGFRNPDGTTGGEIVFVGDSYTEAAQIPREQTFPARTGELLGKSIINLGRGAYGPQQELIVLEKFALTGTPKPDVVVWQLFEGNDLQDAEQFLEWKTGLAPSQPLLKRYLANSVFHPLLMATERSKAGTYVWYRNDAGQEEPSRVRYPVRPNWVEERKSGWGATRVALEKGATACRAAGVELVVVFVPIAARVMHERWRFVDDAARLKRLPEGFADDRGFASKVRAKCVELGVRCVDLLPVFERAAKQGVDGIYLRGDEHFDVGGHEFVATELSRLLAD